MSEMQESTRRQRELMAQLHDLLFPPLTTAAASSPGLTSTYDVVVHAEDDGRSSPPLTTKVPSAGGGRRGRRKIGADLQDVAAKPRAAGVGCSSSKKQRGSRSMVTTVPDFDGYQWRKYGQKHIEAANHTRSYYRCTNSKEQGCTAKRTVQRNDDDGGPPKYTVVYISEHTCNMSESALAPPVILETTVVADVPAAAESTDTTTGSADVSPADSDVFAGDAWEHPTAALLQQEMELAGPIRSPVLHMEFGNWSYGLLVNELSSVIPNSCHLFGF